MFELSLQITVTQTMIQRLRRMSSARAANAPPPGPGPGPRAGNCRLRVGSVPERGCRHFRGRRFGMLRLSRSSAPGPRVARPTTRHGGCAGRDTGKGDAEDVSKSKQMLSTCCRNIAEKQLRTKLLPTLVSSTGKIRAGYISHVGRLTLTTFSRPLGETRKSAVSLNVIFCTNPSFVRNNQIISTATNLSDRLKGSQRFFSNNAGLSFVLFWFITRADETSLFLRF